LRNKDLKIIFLSKRIQVLCGDKTTKTVSRSITAECLLLMWNYLWYWNYIWHLITQSH